jgi:hypothetical protein
VRTYEAKFLEQEQFMNKARRGMALQLLLACALSAGILPASQAADGTASGGSGAASNAADLSSSGSGLAPHTIPAAKVLKSRTVAAQLANDIWFDKIAAASPELVAAVCAHPRSATILASHPHLDAIANADPMLCRRLTQWNSATEVLLRNPHLDRVVELDPEGMYWAIERRAAYARVLAGHCLFYKMTADNPDLGRVVAQHMW